MFTFTCYHTGFRDKVTLLARHLRGQYFPKILLGRSDESKVFKKKIEFFQIRGSKIFSTRRPPFYHGYLNKLVGVF